MKRVLYFWVCVCMAFVSVANTYNGVCGDNVTWLYDDKTGELKISGEGEMYDYSGGTNVAPWGYYIYGIKSIIVSDGITKIGKSAFNNCSSLKEITIPSSVNFIGVDAFYDCWKLDVVNIEDLSAWCNITFGSVNSNPNSVGYKHYLKLNGELLERFEIPDGIEEIKNHVFHKAQSIISITIPASVKKIGQLAFYDCSNMLRFASLSTTPPTINENTFNSYEKTVLYVPVGYREKYQKATGWKKFKFIGEEDFSSIENTVNDNLPVEYFNMQGVEVENPKNGIYIKRQGSQTTIIKR